MDAQLGRKGAGNWTQQPYQSEQRGGVNAERTGRRPRNDPQEIRQLASMLQHTIFNQTRLLQTERQLGVEEQVDVQSQTEQGEKYPTVKGQTARGRRWFEAVTGTSDDGGAKDGIYKRSKL